MKKLLLLLALLLVPDLSSAQCNGTFGDGTFCGNTSGSQRAPRATPFGSSGHAVPFLDGNNTWGGTNKFTGPVYFGSGFPWLDVKSGANGCPAAVGDGSNDDTAAIQCQITWAEINVPIGAGTIFFPCGVYKVTATLNVGGSETLRGANTECAAIDTIGADVNAIKFKSNSGQQGGTGAGLQSLGVFGCMSNSGSCTKNLVEVYNYIGYTFRDCHLLGGKFAFFNDGTDTGNGDGGDGNIFNCNISGFGPAGGAIWQHNAGNWFFNIKADTSGTQSAGTGVKITMDANGTGIETTFVRIDISGNYTNSITIDDSAGNRPIAVFYHALMALPATVGHAQWVGFVTSEINSVSVTNANTQINVVGSWNPTTATISGGKQNCAGNLGVACTPHGIPTANSCAGFSLGSGSSDFSGKVSFSSATTCSITFGNSFNNAPFCTVTPGSAASTTVVTPITTGFAVTFGTANTSFYYTCQGL